MKPEFTLELKARFFAQYWRLQVIMYKPEDSGEMNDDPDFVDWYVNDCGLGIAYLLLRPLSSITDEEAIEVAKIIWPVAPELQEAEAGRTYLNWPDDTYRTSISDYLRSIGVALGFMGYSVEELVSVGWVRLREE